VAWLRDRGFSATVAAILIAGVALRLRGFASDPPFLNSWDELAWTWAGQSLLAAPHIPISWTSLHSAYPQVMPFHLDGIQFPVVRNWLDHPPLFALLMGAEARAFGETTMASVTPAVIRLVPIALSAASMLISYALVSRLAGQRVALFAVALLALSPWAIPEGRLAESEALLTPMFLGALYLTHRVARGDGGRWAGPLLFALCALAPLVKVPGVFIGLSCVALLLYFGRRRLALLMLAAAVVGLAGFALYGAAINWQQFLATQHVQALRRSGLPFAALLPLVTSPVAGLGGHVPLLDPLWFAGIASLPALPFLLRRESAFLLVPFVVFVLVVGFLGDPGSTVWSGWYRIPAVALIYSALAVTGAAALRAVPQAAVDRLRPLRLASWRASAARTTSSSNPVPSPSNARPAEKV
jgi:4-amino-4-deoxy-L-arabinose transferase-like glycosyltransferase